MLTPILVFAVLAALAYLVYSYLFNDDSDEEAPTTVKAASPKNYRAHTPGGIKAHITYDEWVSGFDKNYNQKADEPVQTTLAGIRHNNCEDVIKRSNLRKGNNLMLIPDRENKYDSTATRVCTTDGYMVGWLPDKSWSDEIFEDLISGRKWTATVEEVRKPTKDFPFTNLLINLWKYEEE